MILSIAWKNIWRNKTRSMVVITATLLGLLAGSFAAAFILGMMQEKVESAISKEVSHIQVHNPKFPGNNEIADTVPDAESVCREIRRIPGVAAVTDRSKILGMAASANASAGVQILGINPAEERRVTTIWKNITGSGGSYFVEDRKNSILIGQKLAQKLKVELHSKVVLRFMAVNGDLVEAAFRVTGIYNTHNGRFDQQTVFVKNTDLARLLESPVPYHEIAVLLTDETKTGEVKDIIQKQNPGLLVQSWTEIQPELGIWVKMTGKMAFIVLGIILFALAFGIINTMLMSVLERTKELGMLMSIGMNTRKVFRMIMLETILLTFTGGILGMIASAAVIRILHHTGIDLSGISKGMESMGFESIVYPYITTQYFVVLSVMILVTAMISAIYPARKALSIKPAEAVKME
jgi:putative ABC transport system permease protein